MGSESARLWLVRHGQTQWNAEGRVQGQTPTTLNEEGFREAETLAEFFAGWKFAAVWSSDLPRAAQTAEVVARRHGMKVELTQALRERAFGRYEGLTSAQLRAARQELGLPQTNDLSDWTGMPDIESNEALWERTAAELIRLSDLYGQGDVLVVTHGGVMARAVYRVLGIEDGRPRRFALSNGLVTVLQRRQGVFRLLSLVDLPLLLRKGPSVDTATMNVAAVAASFA